MALRPRTPQFSADSARIRGSATRNRRAPVTSDSQGALVELFRVMERLTGKWPTNATVFVTARALGFRFKDADGKRLLSKFRPSGAPTAPSQRTNDAPEPPLPRTNGAGATHARGKGTSSPDPDSLSGASARERAEPHGLPSSPASPTRDLIAWFLTAGIEAGAIKGHFAILQRSPKSAEIVAAEALLAHWSRADIEAMAHRLFARKLNKRHPRGPVLSTLSLALLAEWWDSLEPDVPVPIVDGENLDDYTRPGLLSA